MALEDPPLRRIANKDGRSSVACYLDKKCEYFSEAWAGAVFLTTSGFEDRSPLLLAEDNSVLLAWLSTVLTDTLLLVTMPVYHLEGGLFVCKLEERFLVLQLQSEF
jgi:hypothetical protein